MRLPRLQPLKAAIGFYGETGVRFSDLGISEVVTDALQRKAFSRPSLVQESVIPSVAVGKSAVIAAETGSGKTLSYLAPIASLLLKQKERLQDDPRRHRFHAMVLCPNVTLCRQVLSMANALATPEGSPLLKASLINASNPPAQDSPDIIISTPAAMLSFIGEAGPSYGPLWTEEGLAARVRHMVLDEADMLMGGGFDKQTSRLLNIFRSDDRRRVEAKVFEELGINRQDLMRLPRPMQVACWKAGSRGLMEAGYRVPGGWQTHNPDTFGPYWKRQYLFVAATMPNITFSDAGSEIARMFPEAEWLSSEMLHHNKAAVSHSWFEVDNDSIKSTLLRVIKEDADYSSGCAKILVFAGETASADTFSDMLREAGIRHVVYHKNRESQERSEALEYMSDDTNGKPRVMVCTDSVSRGLDIQNVTHVIQAQFAPNAIDFIHRAGRTGRAGSQGKVTSLYQSHDLALVHVLKQYVEEGRPLEAAFSRARSFSRKLKRKGEFIPRGYNSKTEYDKDLSIATETL
ncbi:hypothetical protein CEUSTIGMA_g2896.t1 [Chlamydomonas eustigma]|uniref:DEAD-box RNA helicase n=1 Tax=Chlamydomonas eustigma TaxID=1157962 RepID=A0A250WX82_9CHLO|nr:hypothetical protein CEUSTIGMA_g2896.t1 [Chlamydomonas eustigma]|eukprot:GAX75453.1 hypothetical protein CEUSTIGMA_g2896.t1 [Chlamydomonas eustigma]